VVERASQQFQHTPERVRAGAVDPVFLCQTGKISGAASRAFGILVEEGKKRTRLRRASLTFSAPVNGPIKQPVHEIPLFPD
jgi:hypothetical protein